ncbi:hypothetical protein E2986_03038 [Frieseomelitta varia]|uniref:glycogenin glucosyltransferase n=1 Tax=Frieseomelitta varia TaxID=561572 RepID=A0A833RXJ3_9HYME|nr:hypothetical protein E2986_03038 [Frieseomelitta varia]
MREKLSAIFSVVMEVNVLDSKDEANLALLARPELGVTFTKLHCWRLTQYEKCVFLDADTLVVRNCDELFEKEELSAAPDVGWPDCFNSGVFVYKPSQQTFASITAFAAAKGSFDGGDQGLLNMYFSDWARKDISKHLPFIYNMCSTATYSYLPAFKQFGDDVRIIHFIGITKPWLQYFDTLTGIVQPPVGSAHLQPLLQLWWNIFCEKVHPQLSPVMVSLTETQKESTLKTDKTDESVKSIEVIESTDSVDEVDKGIAQATISHTEEQSLVNNVPITNVPTLSGDQKNEDNKFSTKSGIETLDTKLPIQISHEEVAEFSSKSLLKEASEQINLPIKSSNLIQSSSIEEQNVITSPKKLENKLQDVRDLKITVDIEDTKQSNIRDEKHAKQLLTASEILTVSPVPIQVAESVLQVEPKESMSDSQVMPQEILSSTITPVHLTEVEDKLHINGSTSSINFVQNKEKSNLNNSSTVMSIDTANKLGQSEEASQNLSPIQQVQLNDTAGLSSKNLCIPEKSVQEKTVELEQQEQQDKKDESGTNEIIESIKISSEHEVTESLLLDKAPIRPLRTKDLNAPSTSIQINAQSDLIDQEKVIKKPGKKLTEKSVSEVEMETTDGDGVEKKVGRKIVKKVTKKTKIKSEEGPDDSTVDSSSSSKQKKTIKVVKKGVKSSQIGLSDTTVPETPSSSTSDAPIPPKRKTKTAAVKAIKKSGIEQ